MRNGPQRHYSAVRSEHDVHCLICLPFLLRFTIVSVCSRAMTIEAIEIDIEEKRRLTNSNIDHIGEIQDRLTRGKRSFCTYLPNYGESRRNADKTRVTMTWFN